MLLKQDRELLAKDIQAEREKNLQLSIENADVCLPFRCYMDVDNLLTQLTIVKDEVSAALAATQEEMAKLSANDLKYDVLQIISQLGPSLTHIAMQRAALRCQFAIDRG